jgi:hypothetical protein
VSEQEQETTLAADGLGWLVDAHDRTVHDDVLGRPELVVPVTGSGITIPIGYPSGTDLREALVKLGADANIDAELLTHRDPRRVADVLIERGAIRREDLLVHVGSLFDHDPTGSSPTVDALLRARSKLIVTLNYDCGLEARAAELDIACTSVVLAREPEAALGALDATTPREELVVVHAHGVADDPSTIVLDGDGYAALLSLGAVEDFLKFLIFSNRLVFLGTSLDELHILYRLLELRRLKKRQLLVTTAANLPDYQERLAQDTYLVLLRGYPDADGTHNELTEFVETLGEPPTPAVEHVEAEPEGPTWPEVQDTLPDDYLESILVEKRTTDDDFVASYLVALGTRSSLPLSHVAAAGTRTLIEGLPGSGKSTLLLHIGQQQPDTIVPLRLRATRLDLVGDPQLLLPKWLETAEAFREGERADASRLDTEIFHFLIDGLDEVAYDDQHRAAAQIVAVAAAHPAHAFTVASRRVPALDAFALPEWTRVVQTPGPDWQHRYVESHDIRWEHLLEAAPLLRDLRDLLALPFFLSHTVRLYEAGQLADAPNMIALVGRFVDAALTEAEKTLPRSALRHWLQRLALAMALAARTDVQLEELAKILPEELSAAGDPTGIAERLVSARLLRGLGDGRYAFVHRIFGEVLATEALCKQDPEGSGILDVAAPLISERLRGLRSDWLITMTLLAATSERWRNALAERDPLAAARAVPVDAPIAEREWAARLIWETYVEWRIWLSDYERMTIVEDEQVLADLLRAGELDGLQAEIRTALSEGDRETVGNAIKVLTAVGDSSIEPQLREILERGEDPVLRRFAALAARDLKLDSLFFLVAHRAVNSVESTEAQDAAYAAVDLATPADIVPLALRAVRHRSDAGMILAFAIPGRVAPRDELSVTRARAAYEHDAIESERARLVELLRAVELDESVAEDLVFVAAAWRVDDDEVRQLIREFPEAATRALVAAVRTGAAFEYEVGWILEEVDADSLRERGGSEELMRAKERIDQWKRERDATA